MEKCKFCGKICNGARGLASHVRMNDQCRELWEEEKKKIENNKTYVYCKICGKKLRNISNTHLKIHNITQQEYKNMFPDEPLFADGLLELQKKNRENTILEKYTKNNINIHDAASLDFYIRKYGDNEETYQKYKDRCEKSGYIFSKQYFIDSFGEDEGNKFFKERFDHIKYSKSLEGLIEKYGEEEGNKIFKERKENKKYVNSKEYYIEKYGEEYYKELCLKKIQSIDNYIKKYGEEEGEKKFIEYRAKCFCPKFKSKIATEMFTLLDFQLDKTKHSIHYASFENNKEEYGMILPKSKKYTYFDFYDSKTNKIIEFYGDYWHANPIKYKEDDIIYYPNKNFVKAKEIWEKDKKRLEEIKEFRNIDALIIWEYDWRKNPNKCIQECLNFLNNSNI